MVKVEEEYEQCTFVTQYVVINSVFQNFVPGNHFVTNLQTWQLLVGFVQTAPVQKKIVLHRSARL
ncbi:hypothetical protein A2U01_0051366 [Trifolium medium]|uniref:Uncharacterized protein n=1 Tax=Trifolium medium TaxID=97028 RepID=A0A392R1M9_9FABA|nr:hypothetical protein [Trifolium medium]